MKTPAVPSTMMSMRPGLGPWPFNPDLIQAAAVWLLSQGLAGQRVVMGVGDDPVCVALLLAAPWLKCEVVLVQRRLTADQLSNQLVRAGLSGLPRYARENHPLPGARLLPRDLVNDETAIAWQTPDPEQSVLTIFTSGTSAEPRPVRLRWRQLFHVASASAQAMQARPGQRWCGCLPLDHIAGIQVLWRCALIGIDLRLWSRFDAAAVAHDLSDAGGRADLCAMVPTQLVRVLAAGLSCQRQPSPIILVGGASLDEDLFRQARQRGMDIRPTYALSECAGTVAMGDGTGLDMRVLPGSTVAVKDQRIWVGGPSTCDPHVGELTGDLGSLDALGRLRVNGRLDEQINSGGEKIAPEPIEALLLSHPGIRAALVCPAPDREWGERVVAFVVPCQDPLVDTEMLALFYKHLPGPARPKAWLWVPTLPITELGKSPRRRLGKSFPADLSGGGIQP